MSDSTTRFVDGKTASRITGENAYMLMKLAVCGQIRVRVEPGFCVKFSLEDVERLKEQDL
jgi:hypothetical protein